MGEHKQVWLVYEDDYGGLFSPLVLTHVFESLKDAENYTHSIGNFASIVQSGYSGTLELSAYPYHYGGKYSDY